MSLVEVTKLARESEELRQSIASKAYSPAERENAWKQLENLTAQIEAKSAAIKAANRLAGGTTADYAAKGGERTKGIGLSRESMKALQEAALDRRSIGIKSSLTSSGVASEQVPSKQYPASPVHREPFRVLDAFGLVMTSAAIHQAYRVNSGNDAAITAETGAYAAANITVDPVTVTVSKITSLINVSDEALADESTLFGLLTNDLQSQIVQQESALLLNGSSPTASGGLLNTPGVRTVTAASGMNDLDAIMSGITALRSSGRFVEPSDVIVSPATAQKIRTAKSGGSQEYLYALPGAGSLPNTIWDIPLTVTSAIADDTAVVFNSQDAGYAVVREGISVFTDYDSDDFSHGRVSIRAQERLAPVIVQPSSVCVVTLNA